MFGHLLFTNYGRASRPSRPDHLISSSPVEYTPGRWIAFFEQVVDDDPADVPWSRVAAVPAINRLYAPGSELSWRSTNA